jgi:hypothetical protein
VPNLLQRQQLQHGVLLMNPIDRINMKMLRSDIEFLEKRVDALSQKVNAKLKDENEKLRVLVYRFLDLASEAERILDEVDKKVP